MRKLPTIVALTVLALSSAAHAQSTHALNEGSNHYKWQDSQGLVHFSDSLTAEAMKYGYDLVNDRGLVVQRVPRQLNAEERVAANKIAAEQAAKARVAQDLANADAQMLGAYPDEESFRISQQQALDSTDQQIHTTELNLHSQEKGLTDLLGRAADMERDKQSVPKYIADSIARQRDIVTGQRNTLIHLQNERAQTVQQQGQQLQHYRDLKAAQLKEQQAQPVE